MSPITRNDRYSGYYRNKIKGILCLDGDEDALSLGFALGVVISITPVFGLHTLLALGFACLFRLNAIVMIAGSWVNMPLTAPLIYGMCFYLGGWVLGDPPHQLSGFVEILSWNTFGRVMVRLVIGWLIVAVPAGLTSFFGLRACINLYRSRKKSEAGCGGL
ncbi:DUF2062 domain-containing protein [bacterium]|nr:DUF2062 domain-containing protein [candidate division CSSED10-310 bacterium]